jgi:dTDP-glucose 4,6-dehydratase
MKINILVTGGCGFIGSSFLDLLFDSKKFNIINIDKLTYASNSDYSKIKKVNYEFIRGDIVNQNLIKKCFKKI